MGSIHFVLPWVLVLLAIAIAVTTKFLSLKSIVGGVLVGLLSLLMLGTAIYANMMSAMISEEYETQLSSERSKLEEMQTWKYQHLDQLSLLIARLPPPSGEELAMLKKLKNHGWQPKNSTMNSSLEAITALEQLMAKRGAAQRAIYLYKGIPDNVDKAIVKLSLTQLGYKVIPPRADETPLKQANHLSYGKYVDIEDLRLTALTLMSAGIPLTSIKPFKKDTRGNVRAVKLDWNPYGDKQPRLKVDTVVNAKKF